MKVIIKTAGKFGNELRELMEQRLPNIEVVGYTDNDCNKWNTVQNSRIVYSPFKCAEMIKKNEVDKVIIPMKHRYLNVKNMFFELNGLEIDEEDILISSVNIYDFQAEVNIDNAFLRINDFNYINITYCSTFKCNLNCKKCSVFSPIHKDDYIDTFEDFKKQILRLKQIIPHITNFGFLGGEPLLQKDLGECIKLLHSVYPITKISIVTNALLVKSMSSDLLKILHDYNVTVGISVYPVMNDKLENVYEYLKNKNIDTRIAGYRVDFSPIMCDEHCFPYKTLENICNCYTLYRGGISPCAHFHSMKKFNETFGTDYEYMDGIVDVFDENLKPSDIMPRLTKPSKLCGVCSAYKNKANFQPITTGSRKETVKWDYYKSDEQPKAEDWFE